MRVCASSHVVNMPRCSTCQTRALAPCVQRLLLLLRLRLGRARQDTGQHPKQEERHEEQEVLRLPAAGCCAAV